MNSKKVLSNLIWRFMERCGAQLVSFVVSIILARLLCPEDYGIIALVAVFITILQTFVDSGFANALIQKKDADDIDFSSVFYFNITSCTVLYIVMFFAAPYIAAFYKIPELIPIVRVISLKLIIAGLKNVQQAYVSRNMMFKKFFYATLAGTIGAAIVGISMAYAGLGVWALVAQQLFNLFIDTVILWIVVKWRPKKVFSFQRLKGLLSYGWKLLAVSLINNLYNQGRQLAIGKVYTPADLALYNKGRQFPDLFVANINTSIDSVLLPAMSKEQDNVEHVKAMTRRSIRITSYILAPFMVGLALVSKPLTIILLTEKWIECVPFMQVFCVAFLIRPISSANLNAMKAMGRSDLFLKIDIIKIIIGIILLILTVQYGALAVAYGYLASVIIGMFINVHPNKELLGYGYIEQIKDLFNPILPILTMIICVGLMSFLKIPPIIMLCVQVVSGVLSYVLASWFFKNESFGYSLALIKRFIKR